MRAPAATLLSLEWISAYWLALLLVACVQVAWWLDLLMLAAVRTPSGRIKAMRGALRMSSSDYLRRVRTQPGHEPDLKPEDVRTFHQRLLALHRAQRQEALVLGSLGLAAWAAIGAASAGVAKELNNSSLNLLFVGVVLAIAGPVLFSRAGTRTTHMGLQSLVVVGYDAIVLWLAYAITVIFGPAFHVVGIFVALCVIGREVVELISLLQQNDRLFRQPGAKETSST